MKVKKVKRSKAKTQSTMHVQTVSSAEPGQSAEPIPSPAGAKFKLEVGWSCFSLVAGALALVAAAGAHSLMLVSLAADCFVQLLASFMFAWRLWLASHGGKMTTLEQAREQIAKIFPVFRVCLELFIACNIVRQLVGYAVKPVASNLGVHLSIAGLLFVVVLVRTEMPIAVQSGDESLKKHVINSSGLALPLAIVLVGLILNATLQWWWFDLIAAELIVRMLFRAEWEQKNDVASA